MLLPFKVEVPWSAASYRDDRRIRVFRSSRLSNEYAPTSSDLIATYRYDGLYQITKINNSAGDIINRPIKKRFNLSIPRGKSGEQGCLFTLIRREKECRINNKQLLAMFHKTKASTKDELKKHWKDQEKRRGKQVTSFLLELKRQQG